MAGEKQQKMTEAVRPCKARERPRLQPGPALAVTAVWGVKEWIEDLTYTVAYKGVNFSSNAMLGRVMSHPLLISPCT